MLLPYRKVYVAFVPIASAFGLRCRKIKSDKKKKKKKKSLRSWHLPCFTGFKSFCPPTTKPAVAFYVSLSFLSFYTMLPVGSSCSADVFHLHIHTPTGCFGTGATKFRLTKVYSHSLPGSTISVKPTDALPNVAFPCLAAGDFNIHNHANHPLRVISRSEEKASTPYYNRATDLAYSLLNTPGVYTRFPLSGSFRPSAIDLAFANPLIRPAFQSRDATTLPSTGSDHLPILIHFAAPTEGRTPPDPCGTKPTGSTWKALSRASISLLPRSPPPRTNLIRGSLTPSTPSQQLSASTPRPHAPPLNQSPGGPRPSLPYAGSMPSPAGWQESTAWKPS